MGNRLTFEASPNYLYYEFVPERIKKDLGILKMIAILREPVSRAYSGWQMFHSFENIDNAHLKPFFDKRNFSEAVEEEFQSDFDYNKYPFRYDYVGRGRYVEQLENYCHHFGKENLLVLNFTDIHKNIPLILDQVCKFLNLNPFPEEIIQKIQTEKYNSGKYKSDKTPEDEQTIENLKSYFAPYNEKLYDFLGNRYNW
ncbi:sulfotransferase domain-containing protein [Aphanothece sacrum]|uniref:Sulfotransferase n=1 Tax=Aphanothece sacrum FPU1 TaxID=1920663 RepID=A0A401IJ86_APHSA|nr:sulfotransferase domain-containing protein [Aphanothece sacrum]GBF81363.1 sulfotransferase [Aphanothece sacrum FPU1]GBF86116.1 sulfotransferase [Aphanothece sacrum FPU3]